MTTPPSRYPHLASISLLMGACLLVGACTGQLLQDELEDSGNEGSDGTVDSGVTPDPSVNPGAGSGGASMIPDDGTLDEVFQAVSLLIEENDESFCPLGEDVEYEHTGYTGDGYVNTVNAVGSAIEWSVSSPIAQTVTLSIRYASESTPRPGVLLLDGGSTSIELALPASGAWTTWAEETVDVAVSEGSHRLRLEATTEDGLPNIDSVTISGMGLSAGSCIDESLDPVCSPGAVECLNGTTPQICSPDGQWQAQSPCEFACLEGGTCGGSCSPGSEQCLDANTPQICDAAGVWQSEPDCEHVCQPGGTCGGACTPGDRQCQNSTTPSVCTSNGTWEDEPSCSSACISGVCSTCAPGAKQCLDSNTPQTCGQNGTWDTQSDCQYVCSAGNCTGSCVPGDRECQDSNTPRLCSGAGSWQNEPDCAYVCDDGVCTGSCVPGTKQCSGSLPQTCNSSGTWTSGSSCPNGCTSGECDDDDEGTIGINDPVPGWASVAASGLPNGTTGGGKNVGSAVTVSSMSALQNAASGSSSAIILVQPGTYSGTLSLGSNKTIIGTGPGVTIRGNVRISNSSNIIVRNLAVRGDTCSSYDACRDGPDAIAIENSAHHIWLDHLDVADGEDGNCDITKEADYVTVSFTKFHYTYNKEHRFSNLISSSDTSTADAGKLRITYMNSWWGQRVNQRMPRGRFGKIHLLNNYFSSQDSGQIIHGPGVQASYIIEGCYYEVPSGTPSIKIYDSSATVRATNNSGTASGMNQTIGSVFSIPYSYDAISSSQVKSVVTASSGGAGNTCTWAG